MNSLSSDNEIFLIQRNYKTDTESENDTDDFVSDIPGLEQVKSNKKVEISSQKQLYALQCSDISSADDELLILTAEKVEKKMKIVSTSHKQTDDLRKLSKTVKF